MFASATVTALSTVLDVTAVGSGTLAVGSPLSGTGIPAGTKITALISGAGGIGTYRVNNAATTISETIAASAAAIAVVYDSISGGFQITSGLTGAPSTVGYATGDISAALKLTSATGAMLSQGAAAAVPGEFMDGVLQVTQNWASFMTSFDPDASGNAEKLAFAAWASAQDDRYVYVCWDTDVTPTQQVPATASLGYLLDQSDYSGICLIYEPSDLNQAAFVCGSIAAIDFEERNGRITFAYKNQAGLVAGVSDETVAVNLGGNPQTQGDFGNGYNYYGAAATANQDFVFFQRGLVSGPFRWLDSFVNQIWLNSAFQLALLSFMSQAKSIPYSAAGYSRIEAALSDVIKQGLSFGAFGPGSISDEQSSEVNNAAGVSIAKVLQTQGWYLQVLDASSLVRASRGSPPMKFWYLDRGSVQAMSLTSIAVQ